MNSSREDDEATSPEKPPPDPNTKEGRLELYNQELEKKMKKFLQKEKKNRGLTDQEIALEKTRAFKVVRDTPSPQPEDEEQENAAAAGDGDDKTDEPDPEDAATAEEEEEEPCAPGCEDMDDDAEAEPNDGLSPKTRAKNRVADVIAKINNIVPPENWKPEPEPEIRPEVQANEGKQIKIGGYFARVITEEDERRGTHERSRSRERRHRRSRSRDRRRRDSRDRYRRRSRSRDRYKRRSRSRDRRRERSSERRRSSKERSHHHHHHEESHSRPEEGNNVRPDDVTTDMAAKVEQENIIDSTNEIMENVKKQRSKSRRSMSKSDERYRSPSPSPVKKKRESEKEKSLSPGTKEIRAYWAEQEEKKKSKKSKKSKDKERDEAGVDMFAEQGFEFEKKRHGSGDSIDSVEKLRLQALETLKRAQNYEAAPDNLYNNSDDDDEYVEKKHKKSKKHKRDKSPDDAFGLLEEILENRKKSKKSKSSDSEEDGERKRKKKKKKRHSSSSDSGSDSSGNDIKKAWEEIKMKWEKKLKKKRVSESD